MPFAWPTKIATELATVAAAASGAQTQVDPMLPMCRSVATSPSCIIHNFVFLFSVCARLFSTSFSSAFYAMCYVAQQLGVFSVLPSHRSLLLPSTMWILLVAFIFSHPLGLFRAWHVAWPCVRRLKSSAGAASVAICTVDAA